MSRRETFTWAHMFCGKHVLRIHASDLKLVRRRLEAVHRRVVARGRLPGCQASSLRRKALGAEDHAHEEKAILDNRGRQEQAAPVRDLKRGHGDAAARIDDYVQHVDEPPQLIGALEPQPA